MTDVVKSLRNPLILIVGLLLAWQLLYWFAGDIAMRAPAATIRYTANLLTTDTFWVHSRNPCAPSRQRSRSRLRLVC